MKVESLKNKLLHRYGESWRFMGNAMDDSISLSLWHCAWRSMRASLSMPLQISLRDSLLVFLRGRQRDEG
jgi:hypothetical protein